MSAASLAQRHLVPELMDDPSLDPALHRDALAGLRRINALSGAARGLWRHLEAWAEAPDAPLRVLDLACGGGDVAIQLQRLSDRTNLGVEVDGCDMSGAAIARAASNAQAAGVRCRFHRVNVLTDPLPAGYDAVVSNLFFHHLDNVQILALLQTLKTATQRVLINDLRRGRAGLFAAQLGTRLLSRSPIVHVDGPRSVRAALSTDELRALTVEAGMVNATVRPIFPFRLMLRWEAP